jgi:hypothetical protein
VQLLDRAETEASLGISLSPEVASVGFQSENRLTNRGNTAWQRETGLLSIWVLGMFKPSPATTVVIPYRDSLMLNTRYFGEIGTDRLKATPTAVLFKGDGQYRCKIGLPPQNTRPWMGSYDPVSQSLTLVNFSFSESDTAYVNSLWEYQEHPYAGDVVNSYNDGPNEQGDLLGPFYELESSSSARALSPGETMTHRHTTFHLEGPVEALNLVSEQLLGIPLDALVW